MKILFLDIDGVLNSQRFFDGRKWSEHVDQLIKVGAPSDIQFWADMIDPVPLAMIDDLLLDVPGLFIVISSSWREVHPLGRLQRIFELAAAQSEVRHHISGPTLASHIFDRTDVGGPRECAIADWALRFGHEISAWAVLDDLRLDGLEDRHVRTTWADGLTKEHIDAVRELLK